MSSPVIAILGVGPGIGIAVAKKFLKNGFSLALMARTFDKLQSIVQELDSIKPTDYKGKILPFETDATDAKSVEQSFRSAAEKLGPIHVLVYNAGSFHRASILETSPEEFEQHWKSNCFGGFLAAKAVLPNMIEKKKGTILFTGATASLRGAAGFQNLSVGKFGLRSLAQTLAREYGPQGIHVAHIIIDGQVDLPYIWKMTPDRPKNSVLNPDAIAENYWNLYQQDSTTWTHELDLRPLVEKF